MFAQVIQIGEAFWPLRWAGLCRDLGGDLGV